MSHRWMQGASFTALLLFAPPLLADRACPTSIAMTDMGAQMEGFAEVLRDIYQRLGCQTEFIVLPGRRGIRSFNHGLVDGESVRLRLVEPHYTRAFVRSSVPLYHVRMNICSHPDATRSGAVLGYVRGLVWHEEFVAQHAGASRVFDDQDTLIAAYNAGEVSDFLCEDYQAREAAALGEIQPVPLATRALRYEPVYHYLDQRYTPFMQRFSELVEAERTFTEFN